MDINLCKEEKPYGINELIRKKEEIAYRVIQGDFKNKISFSITEKRINKIFKVKSKRYERHKIIDSNFTYADNQWIKHLFEHRCFNCGSKKNLQIDHHMPLSLGYGLKIDDKYNAVLLCKRCNGQKSSLLPTKFYTPSQLKILEISYDIHTHKDKHIDNSKNIDAIIDFYEKSLKDKALVYLEYLDYLWNQKKISKYRLKKEKFYKIYYIEDGKLQIISGKIKYNFFLGILIVDDKKIKLKNIKGVVL